MDPRDTLETIETLNKLEKAGMDDAAFRRLHHFRDTPERSGLETFRNYCNDHKKFTKNGNNQQTHQRLQWVLDRCQGRRLPPGEEFDLLIDAAFRVLPKL